MTERRPCTVCMGHGERVDATHVARAEDGTEWFECGKHDPACNEVPFVRVSLTPIAEWFASHGLPVPGVDEFESQGPIVDEAGTVVVEHATVRGVRIVGKA